jgi:hypothetical protein
MMKHILMTLCALCFCKITVSAQEINASLYWQDKERELRYQPEGEEFVNQNGDKRFTRAIYGTNTGFRFETSDFPEFALYMPNFGGSLYMAIATPTATSWIKDMDSVESRFKSGQRTYIIKDKKHLGRGVLTIEAVALSDGEGFVLACQAENIPVNTKILWVYGGASGERIAREGDMAGDAAGNPADFFSLKANNCRNNLYQIEDNRFTLSYGKNNAFQMAGTFPEKTVIQEADGNKIDNLNKLITSSKSTLPLLIAEYEIGQEPFYLGLHNPRTRPVFKYAELSQAFDKGIQYRTDIASRMKIQTPDPFLNTLGGIFSGAEDAAWENPVYLHGAIRFRDYILLGWRGAYLADLLGLEERAKTHFNAFANSQITNVPVSLPHLQESTLNLAQPARQWGTPMYSNGYICRVPNRKDVMLRYDMNLVYIDQLLWHLNWTGDMEYARKMFPVIKRHLAWEKNTFDADNDGLYDAVACIWASDGLQYNGGKVTHSSAYNYRANKMAAEIAEKLGENATVYKEEASLILSAINRELWIKNKGRWAEFKDNMGHQILHEEPALWTFYHAIDSEINDPFQAYQASRYIDTELSRIPVIGKGIKDSDYYVVPTTNWQPYDWSINNVAFAENMHTALAYWQSGRNNDAFRMFKGVILDAMYMGNSPGNVAQVSFYDAARGESYRDFSDATATGVRAVVHGMFGILPDLMNNRLLIKPGFPDSWDFAEFETHHISYSFRRSGNMDRYSIVPNLFRKGVNLAMEVKASTGKVKSILVNGKKVSYTSVSDAVLFPRIKFEAGIAPQYDISIEWEGIAINKEKVAVSVADGEQFTVKLPGISGDLYDPQEILEHKILKDGTLTGRVSAQQGHRTLFIHTTEEDMTYWLPVDFKVNAPLEIINHSESTVLAFELKNNTDKLIQGTLFVNGNKSKDKVNIPAKGKMTYRVESPVSSFGTNKIEVKTKKSNFSFQVINWNLPVPSDSNYEAVAMQNEFNDKLRDIFQYGKYISPRWQYTTLQTPTQGMSEWCHPQRLSLIDDRGIRKIASQKNDQFMMPQGIPFATPGELDANNVLFTSLWDNYPTKANMPLKGKSSKAYFLVAASTYHMQAHILNGQIRVKYKDGMEDVLDLVLPDNLLPLDQDIFIDDWAFKCPQPRPWRVRLKTGEVSKYHAGEMGIKMSNDPLWIEGGMATLLDLPLNPNKELDSLTLETIANEVVIGLIGVTLIR